VEDSLLGGTGDSRFTMRLRLEPAGPANAHDLWRVHGDDEVWPWYGDEKPSLEQAEQRAKFMGDSWRFHGVHKWIAYVGMRYAGEIRSRGMVEGTEGEQDDAPYAVCVLLRREACGYERAEAVGAGRFLPAFRRTAGRNFPQAQRRHATAAWQRHRTGCFT
jgi:hypothetical protein